MAIISNKCMVFFVNKERKGVEWNTLFNDPFPTKKRGTVAFDC